MLTYSLQGESVKSWDDEIKRTTEMFFEADRLDEAAYAIISETAGGDVWARYTEAKGKADKKRTEAYQSWIQIRRTMRLSIQS